LIDVQLGATEAVPLCCCHQTLDSLQLAGDNVCVGTVVHSDGDTALKTQGTDVAIDTIFRCCNCSHSSRASRVSSEKLSPFYDKLKASLERERASDDCQ
jgi:hypothetical protein